MSKESNSSSIVGFPALLFLVFLVLKLLDKIDWSWWWVTSPIWGSFAILITFLLIVAVVNRSSC